MSNAESNDTARVFMSGKSQAVRLPKKFRFTEGCDEVSVRQIGRHLILSPRYSDWDDYWANSTRPSDDFVDSVLKRKESELPAEERVSFD
ncbi:MAG: AbrB/MazE/SpoVT family DNA-binding domain-containing protein [Halieaceae bacterium]|jgi:antitoxin VapB|nr:AbrB/MazE/SpoVT family DNA-binding domain-containing protein [Halieaceae bacterium]